VVRARNHRGDAPGSVRNSLKLILDGEEPASGQALVWAVRSLTCGEVSEFLRLATENGFRTAPRPS